MSDFEATDDTETVWHVQLSSGDVRVMTLDELDDAYQEGVISDDNYVWEDGSDNWQTLGELLGTDSDEAPSAPEPEPDLFARQVSRAPAPAQRRAPSVDASVWPPVVTSPSYAPSVSYAPAAASIPRGGSMAPSAYPPSSMGNGPYSTAPVAFDVDDDFDMSPSFRPKKRRGLVAVMALAVLGGGGFALTHLDVSALGSVGGGSVAAAMAPAAPAMPAPVAAPPLDPMPAPQAATPAPGTQAPATTLSLTEDQKRALAEADNKRAAKVKAKSTSGAGTVTRSAPMHTAPVFHKGGSPHDPLNSSL